MRMHPLIMVFLGLVALCSTLYTGYALVKVWDYWRLDEQVMAETIIWGVREMSDEAYIPEAHYHYVVQDQSYEGTTLWNQTYLNGWAAKEAISRMEKKPHLVWYDSSSPTISSLQKVFPYKECYSAVFLWMLATYFFVLGRYRLSY